MKRSENIVKNWVYAGIITGLLASVVYPLLIFVEMPNLPTVFLAGAFGPLFSFASIGLYNLLKVHRKTVTAQLAAISNILAGTIVNMMLIVQLATRMHLRDYINNAETESIKEVLQWISRGVLSVQSGLDVSWDFYIAIGTFFFALNMLSHPRFGKFFGWTGIALSVLLLAFNVYTFPTPPASAGLIDFGPFVGLWYLAVTIQAWRSLKWVDRMINPSMQKSIED